MMQDNGYRAGAISAQSNAYADAPKAITMMDAHLCELRAINTGLYSLLERTQKIADRMFGAEPQKISAGTDGMPKPPSEPPASLRLQTAAQELGRLNEAIHVQIQRLEQL